MPRTYATPLAFETAVEQRLRNEAAASGMDLQRRRQLFVFDRFLARLFLRLEDAIVSTAIPIRCRRRFGHKLCLTTGASSFVLDRVIEDGNPADSTLATRMIERQEEIFDRVPRQAAMDGGFASKANLADIKQMGVKDVAFHEKRGLEVAEMVKSSWVYKQLRRFRAGIEGNISFLERCFGLGRCLWRGLRSFKAYVWSSVISANLLILARHRTTTSQFRTPIHPAWRRCASSE